MYICTFIHQMDILFYINQIDAQRACLTGDEFRHAVTVLRRRVGDAVGFTDGKGRIYHGKFAEISKKEAWIDILDTEVQSPDAYQIHLAVAPTKSFDRMSWCLEKLTEVGISSFTPLICARSERQKWNADRARKVALSAMKQSKRAWLPECNEAIPFTNFLTQHDTEATRFIALKDAQSIGASGHYTLGSNVIILIGPEGDFTEGEVAEAKQQGFIPLTLGSHRLRTETAALAAAVIIHSLNQH
jgi:16S rRNA (uracil1498-N3)-methyltransferase